MSESPAAVVSGILTQARILSLAFAAGVLLFAAVATGLTMGDSGGLGFVAVDAIVEWAVAAVALGIGFAGGTVGRLASAVPVGADVDEIRQKTLAGSVIASALRESAGLIGGIVILNSGNLVVGWSLAALSVILLVTGTPDASALEAAVRRAPLNAGDAAE